MDLKQVIIINHDNTLDRATQEKCLAKASMSLMTRCFEGAEGFIGKHENKTFHKVVIDWIDNHDQEIELYEVHDADMCDVYFWTAEVEGIPSKHIYHNKELACTVIGPAESDRLDAFLIGIDLYGTHK